MTARPAQAEAVVKTPLPGVELPPPGPGSTAEGFWRLWNQHQRSLRRLCLREMNGHPADAEDALSEVMLKALDRLPSYEGRLRCPEAWLRRLARNVCIDLRRERHRKSETVERWRNAAQAEPEWNQPMLQIEAESNIHQRIAALPVLLRESFILHVVREIPARKAASLLGLTPANVRKRAQLARVRLRRDIEDSRNGSSGPGPAQTGRSHAPAAKPPRPQSNRLDPLAHAAAIRTVRVKLPCGVEHLFHVFPAKAPVSPERQIRSVHKYLRRHPDSWKKRLELAEWFHITGDWNRAVCEWHRALAIRPHLPTVLKLGDTLLKQGSAQAATEVFRHALTYGARTPAAERHLEGWIAFCENDANRAVKQFQSGADLEPGNPVHWHALALAHRRAGSAPDALAIIGRALKRNPNDLQALSFGHELLVATGQIEEAIGRALQLLNLAPLDLLTLRRLVECRCQLGLTGSSDGLETKQLLRRALRRARNSLLIHEPLAAFSLSQGEQHKALALHREFVEQYPHCPRGRRNLLRLQATSDLGIHLQSDPRGGQLPTPKECNGACRWYEMPGAQRA